MIVPDANLLIYAYDATCPDHASARAWLEDVFSSEEPVGIPWPAISAFLRIQTDTRIRGDRFTMQEAVSIVDRWFELPQVLSLAS